MTERPVFPKLTLDSKYKVSLFSIKGHEWDVSYACAHPLNDHKTAPTMYETIVFHVFFVINTIL